MRLLRYASSFVTVAVFLLIAASAAKADGVDPKIGLGGGGSCAFASETSTTETFHITNFDCPIDFQNQLNFAIASVTVTLPTSFAGLLTCAIDSFQGNNNTTFSNPPFNNATASGSSCTFSGAGALPDAEGVAPGQIPPAVNTGDGFSGGIYSLQFGYSGLDFTDAEKASGIDISITASPAPEPASLFLLGTGLAALAVRRKKLLSPIG